MAATRWISVVAFGAGCASTVAGSTTDATSADGRSVEVEASDLPTTLDVPVDDPVDAATDATLDASVTPPPDVPLDARVCTPIVDDDVPVADVPDTGPYVVDLSMSSTVTCARMSDGTLRCRSANDYGELGIGSFGGSWRGPVVVPGLSGVEQIATNIGRAACARLRDGTVRCWGSNHFDLLGTGHVDDERCTADYPCRTRPTAVVGLTDVVHLAAGPLSFCAVRRDGTVWCWGAVDVLLPDGGWPVPMRAEGVSGVARLWSTSWGWVARLDSGAFVRVSARGPVIEPLPIPPGAEFTSANEASSSALCFRLPDATARCFGTNRHGNLGDGTSSVLTMFVTDPVDPGLCGVRSAVGGPYISCALLVDHTVSCWGYGEHNALGDTAPDTCVGIDGRFPEPCATRPMRVRGLTEVQRVFSGIFGGCALRFDRTVWCWGTETGSIVHDLTRVEW